MDSEDPKSRRRATADAVGKAATWLSGEVREWSSRRPERKAARGVRRVEKESRGQAKAEARRTKKERKTLKGMVRRTCKQCGHEWVVPRKLIKAGRQAGLAAVLGQPVPAIAFGSKVIDMDTCAKCGSVRFFDEERL